jgi:hypothetical protein
MSEKVSIAERLAPFAAVSFRVERDALDELGAPPDAELVVVEPDARGEDLTLRLVATDGSETTSAAAGYFFAEVLPSALELAGAKPDAFGLSGGPLRLLVVIHRAGGGELLGYVLEPEEAEEILASVGAPRRRALEIELGTVEVAVSISADIAMILGGRVVASDTLVHELDRPDLQARFVDLLQNAGIDLASALLTAQEPDDDEAHSPRPREL